MPLPKSHARQLRYWQACLLEELRYLHENQHDPHSTFHRLEKAYEREIKSEIAAAEELIQSNGQFDAHWEVRDPSGIVRLIPAESLEMALRAGGELVGKHSEQFAARGKERIARMNLLTSCIYPNRHCLIDYENGLAAGDHLVGIGFSFTEAVRMVERAKKQKAGRPSRFHPRIVEAYDAMRTKRMSYPEVADKFCDCGKDKHDLHCADKWRKRLERFEEFLDTLPPAA